MRMDRVVLAFWIAITCLALSCSSATLAKMNSAPTQPTSWFEKFLDGAKLVTLPDRRQIEIYCEGSGSPLVILDAGLGDGAWTWNHVQDAVAGRTKVCAFNRAGIGRSSPAIGVRDTKSIIEDIDQVLARAKLGGPYILVGHSLGGLDMELFAFEHPKSVIGIVLVDPSVEGEFAFVEAMAPGSTGKANASIAEHHICAVKPRPASAVASCVGPTPTGLSQRLSAYLTAMQGPDFYHAVEAEWHAIASVDYPEVSAKRRPLGSTPLIVLTSSRPDWPGLTDKQLADLQAWWVEAHKNVAALSTVGTNRTVPDTTHFIQAQKPEVVVDAIGEVIAGARAKASASHPTRW